MSDTIIVDGGETITVSVDALATPDSEIIVTVSNGPELTWSSVQGKPSTFPPSSHNHDDRYYTETETDTLLAGKQAAGSCAATVHQHTIADVTGLQTALNAKATPADISTAVASLVNSAPATLDTLKELADALGSDAAFSTTVTNALAAKAPIASPTFTGTVSGITKSMVGLGNVDNTSDAAKPISTATQTALNGKQATLPNGNYLDLLSFNGASWTNVTAADYATATGLVQASDARLSDARTPLSHTHAAADVIFAATDRLLGRSSAGAGAGQEIVCTAAGRALLDDADAAAQRTTLGLGTASVENTTAFAAASHNQAWSTITSTPTTRAGYGITDAQKTITSGTAAPSGGTDGDIYLQYT